MADGNDNLRFITVILSIKSLFVIPSGVALCGINPSADRCRSLGKLGMTNTLKIAPKCYFFRMCPTSLLSLSPCAFLRGRSPQLFACSC